MSPEQEKQNTLSMISPLLLAWYGEHARSLPWRILDPSTKTPDPYHVWISEIMLQQTRVETVKEYYRRFLERLPNVQALATVSEDELLKLWQGLGYYSRARNLQKAAQIIMDKYHGQFPASYDTLLSLPGIGEYTAGAISSIAFSCPVPAIDGNVYRIYTRIFEEAGDITKVSVKKDIHRALSTAIPADSPGTFNQAWMDLGSMICLPNGTPLCHDCPLSKHCRASQNETWMNYPVKPAKKKRQIQERTVIILEYQEEYFLQKRPDTGLLAGLWEFPARDYFLPIEELSALLQQWDISSSRIELLGKGKHIFSHVEWHMTGYLVHLTDRPRFSLSQDGVWANIEKMQREYSIPSALRCYYTKLYGQ